MVSLDRVTDWIMKYEGFEAKAYLDTRGHLTIGYGTNLDAIGAPMQCQAVGVDYEALRTGDLILTRDQAFALLEHAAAHAMNMAMLRIKAFASLPENVQLAVVDQNYNMGAGAFGEFRNEIAALERGDLKVVAVEMEQSDWYYEVPRRAKDDVELVLSALPTAA